MAAGGDVIELVHEQTYLGQAVNNVYFFEAVVGGASLSGLATWFETNVVPAVKGIQNDLALHVNLRLRNLFDAGETYEEPLTGTGANPSGDAEMSAFIAATIRFDHTSGDIRPGFKRWSGLFEAISTDALLAVGYVPGMTALGALLINPSSVPNADWAHVIVGRICDVPNPIVGAVPKCLKYVLPSSQAEAAVGGIAYPVSYEVYTQLTTQNSRKWYT